MLRFLAGASVVSSLLALAAAQTPDLPYATYINSFPELNNFSFSINAAKESGDLWFRMQTSIAPWVGIGFGNQMKNSLVFVVYGSPNGHSITVSARTARDHAEPKANSKIDYELIGGPEENNRDGGFYHVSLHCRNCTSWLAPDGSTSTFDIGSANASMIYAYAPIQEPFSSSDQAATINQHERAGTFSLDMTKSTTQQGPGGIPPPSALLQQRNTVDGYHEYDRNWGGAFHALFMLGSILILMPLGAAWMRMYKRVRFHQVNQSLAALAVLIGFALGIWLSTRNQDSSTFVSAHQILGIVIVSLVVAQVFLGYFHHRIYKKTQQTTSMATIHRYLGLGIILGGIVNGFLGFAFAGESGHLWTLGVLVVAVVFVLGSAVFLSWRRTRATGQQPLHPPGGAVGGGGAYPPPPYAPSQPSVPDNVYYGHQGSGLARPQQRPPLYQLDSRSGASESSVQLHNMRPTEARGMI